MDSLRGKFGFSDGTDDDVSWDDGEEESHLSVDDVPPAPVGQDERRMQVRAYNFWASLLGERSFPSVEDLEPDNMPDFAGNSVLLDFTAGIENPAIAFLGDKLAGECGSDTAIETLADVPARSLLSRITDHYMQILANEAPIGFEAEFSNHSGATILYRGILLPFSTDDETIDFIYGVINWKEVADQLTTDELLLQIDDALDGKADERGDEEPFRQESPRRVLAPSITRWADGPGSDAAQADGEHDEADRAHANGADDDSAPIVAAAAPDTQARSRTIPAPSFARLDAHMGSGSSALAGAMPAPLDDADFTDTDFASDAHESAESSGFDPLSGLRERNHAGGLEVALAEARALVQAAQDAEGRTRSALYRAVGRAYDVSLAAAEDPDAFAALLDENGIAAVARAPMTPVIKLVFGADYDKSRVAEYSCVLAFAHREGLKAGELADYLENVDGGLKGVVARERAIRRGAGKATPRRPAKKPRVYRRLAALEGRTLSEIPAEGAAFSLCVIRRDEEGEIAFLGEIADDDRLLARAARHLVE